MPKANVDHTISGQGTAVSTLDHSATTPRASFPCAYSLGDFIRSTCFYWFNIYIFSSHIFLWFNSNVALHYVHFMCSCKYISTTVSFHSQSEPTTRHQPSNNPNIIPHDMAYKVGSNNQCRSESWQNKELTTNAQYKTI